MKVKFLKSLDLKAVVINYIQSTNDAEFLMILQEIIDEKLEGGSEDFFEFDEFVLN